MAVKKGYKKYNNKPVKIDGIRFPSKKEGKRYIELKALRDAGEIQFLKLQVTYKLIVNSILIARYRADFDYYDKNGAHIVEDTKGFLTPEYKIKRALMLAIHGIEIKET